MSQHISSCFPARFNKNETPEAASVRQYEASSPAGFLQRRRLCTPYLPCGSERTWRRRRRPQQITRDIGMFLTVKLMCACSFWRSGGAPETSLRLLPQTGDRVRVR